MRRRVGFWLRLGSSDPFVCVVPAGLLRTFLVSTDGRQMTVRYSRRGDIVGAATLFAGQLPSTVRPEPIAVSQQSMLSVSQPDGRCRIQLAAGMFQMNWEWPTSS